MKKPKLKLIAIKLTEEQLRFVKKYANTFETSNVSAVIRRLIAEEMRRK